MYRPQFKRLGHRIGLAFAQLGAVFNSGIEGFGPAAQLGFNLGYRAAQTFDRTFGQRQKLLAPGLQIGQQGINPLGRMIGHAVGGLPGLIFLFPQPLGNHVRMLRNIRGYAPRDIRQGGGAFIHIGA